MSNYHSFSASVHFRLTKWAFKSSPASVCLLRYSVTRGTSSPAPNTTVGTLHHASREKRERNAQRTKGTVPRLKNQDQT